MASIENSFSQIAHVYHRFNNEAVYQQWLAFSLRQLAHFPENYLDLACGTGVFTRLMAPFVSRTVAIDYDQAMIKQAQQQSADFDIDFRTMDMLKINELEGNFDLITCYLDSLCFLHNKEQLKQVFQGVYNKLIPGGIFLCDVWTAQQLVDMDGYYYFEADETAALLWDSKLLSENEPYQVQHQLTVFEQMKESDLYKRIPVTLNETTYELETYRQMMSQAGFLPENIHIYADFSEQEIKYEADIESVERWFIKLVK